MPETLNVTEMNRIERHTLDCEMGKRKFVALSGRAARMLLDMVAGADRVEELEDENEDLREQVEELEADYDEDDDDDDDEDDDDDDDEDKVEVAA